MGARDRRRVGGGTWLRQEMNERMRACFAIPDICSALALLVGFGDGSANFIILRRCVNQKSQEPIHAFCLHNPTERKSDKKKRSSLLPSQPSNLPSIPSLSLPKKRSDPMPHPDRNRPSPPRDRRRRWHRAAVINLPILPPEPTFQERIYAAFQQVGRLGRFVGVDVLVGVPVLGGFSWSCLCYVS